jgi:hypothetical protein
MDIRKQAVNEYLTQGFIYLQQALSVTFKKKQPIISKFIILLTTLQNKNSLAKAKEFQLFINNF